MSAVDTTRAGPATRRLAELVAVLTCMSLQEEIRAKPRAVIADTCVALAGAALTPEVSTPIRKVTAPLLGWSEATVWVTGEAAPAPIAALVNATSGHTIHLDDTHMPSIAHLGVPAVATAINEVSVPGNPLGEPSPARPEQSRSRLQGSVCARLVADGFTPDARTNR